MIVRIRCFKADGFHRDIVIMSERQVHLCSTDIKDSPTYSMHTGLIGVGVSIDPAILKEVTALEVVITDK